MFDGTSSLYSYVQLWLKHILQACGLPRQRMQTLEEKIYFTTCPVVVIW